MARYIKPLLDIDEFKLWLRLSDVYPSGLEWTINDAWRLKGQQAGRRTGKKKYWEVTLCNETFACHRVVYLLRTGVDPGNFDVVHSQDNEDKDNRKDLFLISDPDNIPAEVSQGNMRIRVGGFRAKKKREWQNTCL